MQFGCVALLDTDSPQTFIYTRAFKNMKRVGTVSATCERHTPPRSSGGFGKFPPLETFATVRLSVQFFYDDEPITSLAIWATRRAARTRQLHVVPGPVLPYEAPPPGTKGRNSVCSRLFSPPSELPHIICG